MSDLAKELGDKIEKAFDKIDADHKSSEPIRVETEGIFNQDYLEESGAFIDNPMLALLKPLTQYFEAIKPKVFEPPKTEHKVRIFCLRPDSMDCVQIAFQIEDLLNDGYCCHMPTVVGDFVIMDFSRRKENEENGEQ